jgi:D-sedoheptulose 7-phosphate isomerase
MIKKIKFSELNKSIYQSQKILNELPSLYKEINQIINILYKTIQNNNKIYICGNGGSASDAEHFSTEFLVRLRPKINRKSFPIINLGMNLSYLTACGNDYSFEDIFLRSLSSMANKNDILWVISTSGNSKNILKVLKYAKSKKIKSIAFLGKNGGKAKKLADINLIAPSQNTARIQEIQKFLGHFILEQTENLLLKKK